MSCQDTVTASIHQNQFLPVTPALNRLPYSTPPHPPKQVLHPPLPPHLSRAQLYLHQLVARLLKVQAAHYGQVDGAPQVDNISARLILNVASITTTTTTTSCWHTSNRGAGSGLSERDR